MAHRGRWHGRKLGKTEGTECWKPEWGSRQQVPASYAGAARVERLFPSRMARVTRSSRGSTNSCAYCFCVLEIGVFYRALIVLESGLRNYSWKLNWLIKMNTYSCLFWKEECPRTGHHQTQKNLLEQALEEPKGFRAGCKWMLSHLGW